MLEGICARILLKIVGCMLCFLGAVRRDSNIVILVAMKEHRYFSSYFFFHMLAYRNRMRHGGES